MKSVKLGINHALLIEIAATRLIESSDARKNACNEFYAPGSHLTLVQMLLMFL